jgi:hypothetical protein
VLGELRAENGDDAKRKRRGNFPTVPGRGAGASAATLPAWQGACFGAAKERNLPMDLASLLLVAILVASSLGLIVLCERL